MRALVLIAVFGMASPALATEGAVPMVEQTGQMEKAAPEAGATTAESMGGEAPAAAQAEQPVPAPTPPPLAADAVARGTFATAIDEREPVDSIASLESDQTRVYYFNEFVGSSGRDVTHRWEYKGEVMAEVPIAIGGPRWRAYSSKNLHAGQLGEWTVSVIDESGNVVRKDSFVYEAPAPAPAIAAPTETPAVPESGEAIDEVPASPAPASPAPAQP